MADLLERLQHALVSRYRIERELGRGGMATVYLAEDLKHHRQVAIKVLDPEIAAAIGPERFLREIETVAQLTHPHILPLHDSGVADGLFFYVMPYVEGQSLRARLTREKQLPVEDALRIAREVADALSYAHAHGLVHRDIKPENILLQSEHAAVADFGIARTVTAAGREQLTATGIAVGTPAYMSPEQGAGSRDLDGRSDLYSLGCVLYEMLAGQPPFTGPTVESLVHQHLNVTPRPITELRPAVSAGVAAALQRALAKTPADRFNPVALFAEALSQRESPLAATPAPMAMPASRRHGAGWVWAGAVLILAVAVAAAIVWSRLGDQRMPQPEERQLTDEGNVAMAALSPDGEYLAYCVGWSGPQRKLLVKDLAGGAPLLVADSVDVVWGLEWSPDGARLGFSGRHQGRLGTYLFPRLGGVPQRLDYSPYFAWAPDGARLAKWQMPATSGLTVVALKSGEVDTLPAPGTDKFIQDGDWSPRGDRLALVTTSGGALVHLWVVNLADGSHTLAFADSAWVRAPRWAPGCDAIYYQRDDDLYRVKVDKLTGRAKGPGKRVLSLEGLFLNGPRSFSHTFSRDGRKLVYTKFSGYANFSTARLGAGGKTAQLALTTGTANKRAPVPSPDGTSLAFLQKGGDGWDLFRVSTTGGTPQRLTYGGAADLTPPTWDPTGQRLAFMMKIGTTRKVAVIAADGGSPRVFGKTNASVDLAWAPCSLITYQLPGNRNFSLLDPGTEEERLLVPNDSVGWMFGPIFSPDGNRVAVHWNRRGAVGLWLISLRDHSQTWLDVGKTYPLAWSRDGQNVYVTDSSWVIMRIAVGGGEGVVVTQPALENGSCRPFEGPSGLVWVCVEGKSWSDAWMIENFDPGYVAGRPGIRR